MINNSIKTLEFNKVLNITKDYAYSKEAKDMILSLTPIKDYEVLESKLKETDDAYSYLRFNQNLTFNKFPNLSNTLLRLEKQSALNTKELLDIKHLLDLTDKALTFKNNSNRITSLDKYFKKLNPLKNENINISTKIISENEIANTASQSLQSIRRKKNILQDKIEIVSNRLLEKYKNYLQENIIANKNGKSCLQIKAEYKSYVKGVVLTVSSTGLSFFIEPQELIEINNEISNLIANEQIEIDKILYDISLSLSKCLVDLKSNYENLIMLDFIFAKANYAINEKHSLPLLNKNKNIELINCRHPLLNKETVVPVDIKINENKNILIITGPNTGGKTIFLKTVGLISLMALSGMFIPCFDNSKIAFFDNIYADIGDEQSIEQSLSTFSAHITNIINIINNATKNSLCLFDEIATGTDPVEGASLAIAILNEFKEKKSTVIATTHYPEVKMFALSDKNIESGSFEFDVNTLKPTYKLIIGIPGKSNAFAISKNLGLSDKIIDNAKNLINKNDKKFEDIIQDLHKDKAIISKEKYEIEQLKKETEELKNKVLRQQKGLNDRTNSIIKQAKEEARNILLNAKKLADETIKSTRKTNNIEEIENNRISLNKEIKNITNNLVEKVKGPSKPLSPKKISIGTKVKILSINAEGTVESLPNKDYDLFVRVGILRVKANLRDLELVDEENISIDNIKIKKTTNNGISKLKFETTRNVESSINLIGKTTNEAITELDKYLDDCVMSHLPFARIIHGRGTGALKNAIHNYLKKSPLVKEYRLGIFGEGQDGVTIVNFE